MKKILLHILLVFAPFLVSAQLTVPVTIDWTDLQMQRTVKGIQVNYFSFNNATNTPQFGALPLYFKTFDLPDELFECQLTFKINSADTLSSDFYNRITDAELLSPEIQYDIEYHGKTATVFVLPMIVENKRVIRFTDFEILADFIPAMPAPARTSVDIEYAANSVLSQGEWYKMGITKDGVYKISYSDLQNMGIDPSNLNPKKIGVFGNYAGMLPEENNKAVADDLQENSIVIVGENDGRFDEEDYILFYANSPLTWKYNMFTGIYDHRSNLYADTIYYFLTTDQGMGKRVGLINSVDDEPTQIVTTFRDHQVHEKDLVNLIYSGKDWYGELLNGDTLERTFSFNFPNIDQSQNSFIKFDIVSRVFEDCNFVVLINDKIVIDTTLLKKVNSYSSTYASDVNRTVSFTPEKDQMDVKVKFLTPDPNYLAWINYLSLNVERHLKFTGGQMGFRQPKGNSEGNISRFEITDADENAIIWDITDKHNPLEINYTISGGKLSFTLPTHEVRDFVVFDNSEYNTPVTVQKIENQDLHSLTGVNYIIISPDAFKDQATRLAQLHNKESGIQAEVISPEAIYNEFSSGSQDISAIRNFMKMLYKKGVFGDDPGYLLMFGDASYDYKHRVHDNTNWVPTYQSDESLRTLSSFVTDDYFGLLDDHEGSNSTGELNIGIGRFPVTTHEEAVTAVDKVEHYLSGDINVMRDWRNQFCFVADYGDKNLHLTQAEYLVSIADTLHQGINVNKVFADAFPMIDVPGGKNIPKANELIQNQVEDGSLIINYTGHGGLIGWSKAVILNLPTIHGFTNSDNMPLFITATCEFSRFDDPEFTSAGEYVYLNKNGGAIALLTTTRLAFAHANIVVNMRIYENMQQDENGNWPRLGDLVRAAKIPSSKNYLNFVLLGDPALHLAFPKNNVVTTTVNNKSTDEVADTVHALSLVTINGEILDFQNKLQENFNGYVYPKVFDKPSKYTTLGQVDGYPEDFELMDKLLYEGKVSVKDGKFNFSFLVPKDIAYNYDFGKVSYYALDTINMVDAWGGYEQLYIGGFDDMAAVDDKGPEIELYINDRSFTSGDQVASNSTLFADIFDDYGINFTGNSLGRDLVLTLDDDDVNSTVVNDYFRIDVDSYQSGKLAYNLSSLKDGWHTLSLKGWDLQNNSTTEVIDFYVDDAAEILLSQVMNYPNPFSEYTTFGFIHNKSGSDFSVEIKIYDINGRYVGYLEQEVSSSGNGISPIRWDGKDANGSPLPSGVYTYNILVTDYYGNKTIQRQKMIKIDE